MRTSRCAALIVTLLTLAGLALGAGDMRKSLQFKVGKHPMISINNPYGPVVVKAGAPRQVLVTAVLHSDKVELDQSKTGNRVEIISHLLPGADQNTGLVEYQVLVPTAASVTLHSDSGSIHAEKLHGDLTLEGSNTAMEIVDCGDGHVHVKTLDGPVTLTDVHNGHVEIMSVGGNVQMTQVSGPLVSVNSNSGRIQYTGDFGDEGEYDFTSHTGDIEAVAPDYASIDVLARSNQGRVESDFSLEPRHAPFVSRTGFAFAGTLGKATSSVRLFSFSGRIHLKKRQN
jgi:hypothetical protein